MSVLDDKFTVLSEEPIQGFLRPYQVENPEGLRGHLYWFEVHNPDARTAFHRYKNAIRRLETQGLLAQGVVVSANPGRYYVFWPHHNRVNLKPKRMKPLLEVLKDFGYAEGDLEATEESGRALVASLKPQISSPALQAEPTSTFTPEPPMPKAVLAEATASVKNQTMTLNPPVGKPAKPAPPRGPERRYVLNWPGWLPGLLMVLAGGFAFWQASNRYLNPPQYVLPDMVGKTPTQAFDAVRNLGLKVVFSEGSDPSIPKDQILEQTPDPGTRVKPGRRLELIINKPRYGKVPTLNGRSLQDAKQALEASSYPILGITRIASGDTKDTVLSSIPQEGQPLRQGEGVRLLVSTGVRPAPRETLLPDLSGLTADQAKYILNVAELQAQIVPVASGAPDGIVIGQEPGPGVILTRETMVRVMVGTQPVASIPKTYPYAPERLPEPPPPEPTPTPETTPTATTPTTTEPVIPPGQTEPIPSTNPTANPTTNPTTDPSTTPKTPTTTPTPTNTGPQERRVNVTYSLSTEQFPQGAVVAIVVQDELQTNTVFEGPVEAGWVFPPTEIIVRGTAILRIVVNGQTVSENPL